MRLHRTPIRSMLLSLACFALTSLVSPASVSASGSDVRFLAAVVGVVQTSETEAIVIVRLQSFNVPIIVNDDTEIESSGDEVGLEGLSAGAFIKISGFFSPDGITAEEIDILDAIEGHFRLRGRISAAGPVSGGTLITLLGVDLLVNEDTAIRRRGPDDGITADDLAEGMVADARGILDDTQLVVIRLSIGSRDSEAVLVEFEGRVTSIDGTTVLVDVNGGGLAIVILTDSTTIIGELAVDKFVEIKGTLNEVLAVVDAIIKVDEDGDGDADDDNPERNDGEGRKTRRSARLDAAEGQSLEGDVETEFLETPSGQQTQELELSFHNAERNAEFQLRVTFASEAVVDFGTIRANGGGRVKVKFRTQGAGQTPNILTLLPEGETVENITMVEVLDGEGNLILVGMFD